MQNFNNNISLEQKEFLDTPDDELLLLMSEIENDEKRAHNAWAVFYHRHATYLYGTLSKQKAIFGEQSIQDIVQDTFLMVLKKAHTYRDGNVRGWLGTIARNLIKTYFKNPFIKLRENDFEIELLHDKIPEANATDNFYLEALHDALKTLNENELAVLTATFNYTPDIGKKRRLTNNESKNLNELLGVSSAGVRKIRERAIKKIKESMMAVKELR